MLEGLFVTSVVEAIVDALASAKVEGKLAVIGDPKLAAALAAGREVVAVGVAAKATKKLGAVTALTGLDDAAADGALAAVIGCDVTTDDDWSATLESWRRVVRAGGAIVMIDRGRTSEASRRALCAGLGEIEQRHAGRSVVTSGVVRHLPS